MIIYEITNTESHPAYIALEISNGDRQYDFLRSLVSAALDLNKVFLSQSIIRALNYHAIACLHTNAGEYRPCPVTVGSYQPPAHFQVQALMDDFVNVVNRNWDAMDPVVLASLVLWRLNHIHPFINGNGRTARAASYFVLCCKAGGLLPGSPILPELLKRNRPEYVAALQSVDASIGPNFSLAPLHALMVRLVTEQIASAASAGGSSQPSPTISP